MNKKEAIEIIKKNWPDSRYTMLQEALQTLIPELRESEDEKIRKAIINLVKATQNDELCLGYGYSKANMLAWLEKQGEQENLCDKCRKEQPSHSCQDITALGRCALEKQGEQKPVECIKFDNEFENQISHLIASVLNGEHEYNEGFVKYASQSLLGFAKKEQKSIEQDTEIRDLWVYIREWNEKFGRLPKDEDELAALIDYVTKRQKPAVIIPKFRVGDKIRRKTLRPYDKDMQVASIEGDYYICNHLGKFSSETISFSEESNYELVEQKSAWSEEDERIRKELIEFIRTLPCTIHVKEEYLHWLEKQGEQEQLYIRFGEIPTDEKSKIFQGEIEVGTENGVSVYPAFKTSEGDIVLGLSLPITKTTLYTQQHLIEYDNRPCYLVKGDYVGKDTDGQPLINNVSVIEKISTYRVKEEKQGEQKSTDEIKPKFKVGDWVTIKE